MSKQRRYRVGLEFTVDELDKLVRPADVPDYAELTWPSALFDSLKNPENQKPMLLSVDFVWEWEEGA